MYIEQGLSEEALNAFRIMRSDGLKPSNLALNALINAFCEDRRDIEAFAILRSMKENVSVLKNLIQFFPNRIVQDNEYKGVIPNYRT